MSSYQENRDIPFMCARVAFSCAISHPANIDCKDQDVFDKQQFPYHAQSWTCRPHSFQFLRSAQQSTKASISRERERKARKLL